MKKIVQFSLMALIVLCFASAIAQEASPNNRLYDFKFVDMNFGTAFHSISARMLQWSNAQTAGKKQASWKP